MVKFLHKVIYEVIVKCVSRTLHVTSIMPKRAVQSLPEKKLKPNQSLMNSSKTEDTTENSNLQENSSSNKMQSENNSTELPTSQQTETPEKTTKVKVEYLPVPVSSETDKKQYRVIRLENGLTALLIADTHSLASKDDIDMENNDGVKKTVAIESENEDDDESDDNEDDDETDESDDDDDDYEYDDDSNESDESDESDDSGEDCDRSNSDDRNYFKRLKNEEKMAACGLCVGVGSFSDPPEIPGMAHFLEHMVFMGSEKYPQENDFDAFIKKRCGSDNASTECEQTIFYFEVQEKYLLPTLDRFAQFFIRPLMNRDAISRERESIESEFQMALPSDLYRKEQLFCTFAKPNHPARKFTWGNLTTLQDNIKNNKLYKELHKFRERHYSAHRMTVAIQGRVPLDTLEEYVTQCFSNVPNNGLPPDDFSKFKGADSFDTPNFRKIYKIKPIKDICQLELTWAMPSLLHLYKSKPHQYVSWIIGHEGKGSLISYLREKMWCLDIFSGNEESGFEHSSMYALFNLSLTLTEEGHKHLEDVLNAIFSFINLMKREGPQKRIYDEIHQIEECNFRFTEEVPPAEYVEELCENMQFYPSQDYITGSELYFEYNPDAIQTCMDFISAKNVNIIITDKKFNDDEFDKIEPWFKTKYTDTDIPQEWAECWDTIAPLPEFHLPLPNIFLTDDFSLIPIPSDVPKYPVKIHNDEISEIWYRPDPKFRLPECYMYFYIISPVTIVSARNAAIIDLFIGILEQLLIEELYPATVTEFNHQIYKNDKGIVIKLCGFSQKLPLLLTIIAKYIANCPTLVTKDLFDVMKEEQLKAYYNIFLKPRKLVKDTRLSILMLTHWSAVDKHTAISNVDFDQFLDVVKNFTNHVYIQALVQGNMTKEDVITNVQNCIGILKCGPLLPDTMPQLRVTKIPLGINYCKVKNFNKTDANSVVTDYYQSGTTSIKLSVIIELLLMIMEEPLFNQLRTQEQLGYNVSCILKDTFGILGYSIKVCTQADKYSTDHIDNRIEDFIKSFNKLLEETPVKELDIFKEALRKLKQCADIHLKEEVSRNWAEITSGEYMFDRLEKEIAAIDDITLDELKQWMTAHMINGSNFRKLSVQVVGNSEKINENSSISENLEQKPEDHDNVQYSLEYLVDKDVNEENATEKYVTDIPSYKRSLDVYELNHTTS